MISWIQTRFKRHTKVVFVFLLVAVTIPFVFSINGGMANWWTKEGTAKGREFFGHNLASQPEMRRLADDVRLSTMLQLGYLMPGTGAMHEQEALARAACLALADRFSFPYPTEAELRRHVSGLRLFMDEHGVFDVRRYERLREQLKAGGEFKEADIARVMRDDIRMRRVERLLAGPGYVSPSEVAMKLGLSTTQWFLYAAVFDLDGFGALPAPAEAALAEYFATNVGGFEIPERVGVDYVRFPSEEFVGQESLPEVELLDYFECNRELFVNEVSGSVAGDSAFAAARPKVESALRAELAQKKAAEAASAFALAVFDQRVPGDSPVLENLILKFRGYRAKAPLLEKAVVPPGLNWTKEIVESAFLLTPERFYSDVLPFGRDHIVLLWREHIPRRTPSLEEVRERVVSAYLADQRRRQLQRISGEWREAISGELAMGRSFEELCARLPGAPKLRFCTYGPFTRRQPPDGLPERVLAALGDCPALTLTDLICDKNQVFLVFVAGKRTPRLDPLAPDYLQTAAELQSQAAGEARAGAIREIVQAELARTKERQTDTK